MKNRRQLVQISPILFTQTKQNLFKNSFRRNKESRSACGRDGVLLDKNSLDAQRKDRGKERSCQIR